MGSYSILVVDDFEDGRDVLTTYLRFRGFHVLEAGGGAEAIAIARREHPAVILMDLRRPGTDGWQATRTLKGDAATRDILIVAVTAHAMSAEAVSAFDAGCDAVVAKPFDLTALADAILRSRSVGAAAFVSLLEPLASPPSPKKAARKNR